MPDETTEETPATPEPIFNLENIRDEKFPIKIDDGDADCGGVSCELQDYASETCEDKPEDP